MSTNDDRYNLAEPDHFVDVPKMVEPAEGEVAELVKWLRETGQQGLDSGLLFAEQNGRQLTRAADLLERLAPQPEPEGPSDEELLELSQFCCVSYLLSDGTVVSPFVEGTDMRSDVLSFARAVLARWGHATTAPTAPTATPGA